MSSSFGIYALVCTVIFLFYMAVQITRDIFGNNGKKAESEEEIFDNSDLSGFSQEVNEGGERGYQIAEEPSVDDHSRFQPQGTVENPSEGNEEQQQNVTDPEPPIPWEVQNQEQSPVDDPQDQQENGQKGLQKDIEDVMENQMNTLVPNYQGMYGSTALVMLMNKPMEETTRIRRELLSV